MLSSTLCTSSPSHQFIGPIFTEDALWQALLQVLGYTVNKTEILDLMGGHGGGEEGAVETNNNKRQTLEWEIRGQEGWARPVGLVTQASSVEVKEGPWGR